MTIKSLNEQPTKGKIIIDTTTEEEGNAHWIMGRMIKLNNELGLGYDMDKIIYDEMIMTNYDGLIEIVEKYFGDFVIIYR